MTDGFKIQASVKDADGDMVNVRANSNEELEDSLLNFPVAAYAQFKANVRGGQALGAIVKPSEQAQPQQQQSGGWGQQTQQQAPPPQQNNGGGRWQQNVRTHPEGKSCNACGQVLQWGETKSGKGQWKCGQYRWNNGNPNEHTLEWAN